MRSIPLAITWEMLKRGRWGLLLGALGANALPVFLFAALAHDGATDPADQSYIIMQVVLVQINLFCFGTAVFAAIGPVSRLYTFPISTASIVAWHLSLGMTAVAIELVASTALLNAAFGLGWVLWGPALFAAASFAALQAVLWLSEKSGWVVVSLSFVAIPLALWLKSRYGPLFGSPNHYWSAVTPMEVATLFAIVIPAYFVGVYGVARNRCGQPPYSVGLIAWVEAITSSSAEAGHPLQNPLQAQAWFEWRKKGWAMPGMVLMGLFMGFVIWLLASRQPTALFEGCLAGGAILSIGSFLGGFIVGNVGPNDADYQIGHFLATRPITSADLSRIILKTTGKSVFIAWVIWTAVSLLLYTILSALRINFQATLPEHVGWWYFPATLLGAWTSAGIFAPIMLTGRRGLAAGFLFGGIFLFCGGALFSKNVLSPQAQVYFREGVFYLLGVAFVVWTVWAFTAARRRSLIGGPTLYVAATVWAALCALVGLVWGIHSAQEFAIGVCIAGVFALAVAPLASAPLALTWNRTR
jgi:hypothetical protein